MAHVRDSDTSLWLHNKLGTSNDLWSGGSICSQLNQDVLKNIRECFLDLQSQVKLKLLLSFLHIPRRNVEEWKLELEEILEVALVDSDQWVSMLAELLKSYPSTGLLNFQIEENASVFTDVVNDLKKIVRKHSDQVMLPLECLYLNRTALTSVVGQLPQPIKHFALKQKPKSATLRAELLQKSMDAATNSKKNSTTPSVPIRCRGLIKPLNDATPLRGIPSRVTPGAFKSRTSPLGRLNSTPPSRVPPRTPAGRKDGGIKTMRYSKAFAIATGLAVSAAAGYYIYRKWKKARSSGNTASEATDKEIEQWQGRMDTMQELRDEGRETIEDIRRALRNMGHLINRKEEDTYSDLEEDPRFSRQYEPDSDPEDSDSEPRKLSSSNQDCKRIF